MQKMSTVETLFDDESTRAKYKVMEKLEIMADDARNDDMSFWAELDNYLKFGRTYRITIEELPFDKLKKGDEVVLVSKPSGHVSQHFPLTVGNTYTIVDFYGSNVVTTCDEPGRTVDYNRERVRLKQANV